MVSSLSFIKCSSLAASVLHSSPPFIDVYCWNKLMAISLFQIIPSPQSWIFYHFFPSIEPNIWWLSDFQWSMERFSSPDFDLATHPRLFECPLANKGCSTFEESNPKSFWQSYKQAWDGQPFPQHYGHTKSTLTPFRSKLSAVKSLFFWYFSPFFQPQVSPSFGVEP